MSGIILEIVTNPRGILLKSWDLHSDLFNKSVTKSIQQRDWKVWQKPKSENVCGGIP